MNPPDDMEQHRVPGLTCPHCGGVIDGAATPDDGKGPPREGDLGVCFHCYGLVEYDGAGKGLPVELADERISDEMRSLIADMVVRMKGVKKQAAFRNN